MQLKVLVDMLTSVSIESNIEWRRFRKVNLTVQLDTDESRLDRVSDSSYSILTEKFRKISGNSEDLLS